MLVNDIIFITGCVLAILGVGVTIAVVLLVALESAEPVDYLQNHFDEDL